MAINLDDRYPGRANPKSLSYPQGSFKNRTAPNSKDGTYLEQDWANDQLAFFQSLMSDAGLTANNAVDVVGASQYFDALAAVITARTLKFVPSMTFAQIVAMQSDQGPIRCIDMADSLYVWVSNQYFTGYRNVLCGEIPRNFAPTPRAWEIEVTGGVWDETDPKAKRVIALFRERNHVVDIGAWAKGWGRIASLGNGQWKAPDLQDMFLRMAGTDADTANLRTVGSYQSAKAGSLSFAVVSNPMNALAGGVPVMDNLVVTGTNKITIDDTGSGGTVGVTPGDVRSVNTAVATVILI